MLTISVMEIGLINIIRVKNADYKEQVDMTGGLLPCVF
jgi:hypothetical protein